MVRPITPPGPISAMPPANPTSTQLANRLRVFRVGRKVSNTEIPNELVQQVIVALEGHDTRISELLSANNREVERYRAVKYHHTRLLGAVLSAAKRFRFYALNHRQKGTPEADAKAQSNDAWAQYLEECAIWTPDDPDPLVPKGMP